MSRQPAVYEPLNVLPPFVAEYWGRFDSCTSNVRDRLPDPIVGWWVILRFPDAWCEGRYFAGGGQSMEEALEEYEEDVCDLPDGHPARVFGERARAILENAGRLPL